MELKKQNSYFANNEWLMDQLLLRIAEVLFFAGPLLALFHYENLYTISYEECALFSLFDILVILLSVFCMLNEKRRFLIKYILLLGMQIGVCWIGVKEGMNIFISYIIIPAVSCLYFNQRFTFYITGGSYLIMLASLWPRAGVEVEINYPGLTQWDWFGAFGFGLSVEYIILMVILVSLAEKIQNTLEVLQSRNARMKDMQKQLVNGFANLLESRDNETGHHVRRTGEYVRMIGNWLLENNFYNSELSARAVNEFAMAAPLHDTGKICIPDSILLKQGALTDEEFEIMKTHTTEGYRLIKQNLGQIEDKRLLRSIENTALYHHERWDGSGYPKGISGTEIPLCARIMAAADTLDALLSERCYKRSMNMKEVLAIFEEERGKHFEPCIVDAVVALEPDIISFILEETEKENAVGEEAWPENDESADGRDEAGRSEEPEKESERRDDGPENDKPESGAGA